MLEAAGAAVIFGTTYVTTGLALRSFTPVTIAIWRGAIAAVALGIVVVAIRRWGWPDRRDALRFGALGVINGPIFLVLMNLAVQSAGATIAAFVSGMYAIFAALLAPVVLGERLGARAVTGFALALGGTALLARLQPEPGTLTGIAFGFGAALCFALYLVLTRRWAGRGEASDASSPAATRGPTRFARSSGRRPTAKGEMGAPVALGTSLITTAALLPPVLLAGTPPLVPAGPDPVAVAAVVWMGLMPSVVAQLFILDSVRRIPARVSSAFLLLNPPTAAVGAAVLLGERMEAIQLAGGALVLAGIAIATLPSSWRSGGRVATGPILRR